MEYNNPEVVLVDEGVEISEPQTPPALDPNLLDVPRRFTDSPEARAVSAPVSITSTFLDVISVIDEHKGFSGQSNTNYLQIPAELEEKKKKHRSLSRSGKKPRKQWRKSHVMLYEY